MSALRGVRLPAALALSLAARQVAAQESEERAAPPSPVEAPPPAPPVAPPPSDRDERMDAAERRLDQLQKENERLRDEVEQLRADHDWVESRVEQVMPVTTRVSGYVDVGFFYVSGTGRGIKRDDLASPQFREYAYAYPWVFMGDPLSTAINSRGDPADVGDSQAVKLNPIHSNGKSSALVNNVNVAFFAGIGDAFVVHALVDLLPRSRNVSVSDQNGLGDYLDVKLGFVEWRPATGSVNLVVSAGKVDSLLGYEYRGQEAPSRMTVTPSLICRYTCGRPVGLRATATLFEHLDLGAAITNGSHVSEGFPFGSETDTNHGKTLAGKVAYRFDVGSGLEIGASGAWGAQDFQGNDSVLQRHIGGHAHLEISGLEVTGEYVRGEAQGENDPSPGSAPCAVTPCLEYEGAYGLVAYRVNNWLVPYGRVDFRDALHRSGVNFVYISETLRGTLGVRLEASADLIAKVEYTRNQEMGRIPDFANDIYTSSIVGRF